MSPWKGPVADRMPTMGEKAAEFDRLMEKCRYATMDDVKYTMWTAYNKYRHVYGYDKPGEDAGFPEYAGEA